MTVLTFRNVFKFSSANPANDKLSSFHFQATLIAVAEPSTIEILNSISSANNLPLPSRAESSNHQKSKIMQNSPIKQAQGSLTNSQPLPPPPLLAESKAYQECQITQNSSTKQAPKISS